MSNINYDAEDLRNKTITSPVIQGTANITGKVNVVGLTNVSNIAFSTLFTKTAIAATTNGLALNANHYMSITNSNGATFYIPLADALW